MIRLAVALSTLLLAGCGATYVRLPYTSTAAVAPASAGAPSVVLGEVVDARGEGDTWLGAVRGGWGNPMGVVRTDRPVGEVVQQSFRDALAARGLLAPAGSAGPQHREVRVRVHTLATDRYYRSRATADFSIEAVDRATGRTLYTDRVKVERTEGDLINFSHGAMIEELRALVTRVQNEAIDQLLGKPGFVAAVRPSGTPRGASRA